MFAPEIYMSRRQELKQKLKTGLVLFMGNDAVPRNFPDNCYPFFQDASFLYYWGISSPGLSAVIDIDNDREILFGNDYTVDDIIWMGPQEPLVETAGRTGVKEVRSLRELKPFLENSGLKKQDLHYLPQYRSDTLLKLEKAAGIPHEAVNQGASISLVRAVIEQRSIKSKDEVSQIRSALEITKEMFSLAMEASRPGMYEYQVIGRAEGLALSRDARPAHCFIFTVQGARLHGASHSNRMKEGDIIVMDGGVESPLHYTSDITRSFPVSGRFSQLQRQIYEIVLKANESAIEKAGPGVLFRDIHVHAASVITRGLQEMGLMKGNVQDSVDQGAHALFFPHGLGHPLGLEIHDLESLGEDHVGYDQTIKRSSQFGLSNLRFGKALKKGMVMTIEPGIYFIPELIRSWRSQNLHKEYINYEKLTDFINFGGIRIEDDILVTESGAENLSTDIPKKISDIEMKSS
ncbi:aminopeptidase P family protein [Desulfospira joergensenii]|uniref:aminopeptidase P family protein n=1 Tax=Desulfospira joergensenii TaxID=53329 RepID=UPI0003B500BD|nr:aminopeptidase P family protein [Desulfospira joergensenii]